MKNLAALLLLAAGCTSSATDGAFHVSGRVQGTATHVIAATANAKTVVVHVDSQGSFDLALAPQHAWAIGFADSRQTGSAMLLGTLRDGTLDTLAPQSEGAVDLGTVDIAVGVATASVAHADLVRAMGLTEDDAMRIGAADDLALRLVTPDADNNGQIDALEAGHDYRVDLYSDLGMKVGERDAQVSDLLDTAAPVYGFAYRGTGIEVRMPATYHVSQMATATMAFDAPFYGLVDGQDMSMIPAGMEIGQPALLTGSLDGHAVAALYAQPGYDVPSGTYHFWAAPYRLTFQNVLAPTDEQVSEGLGIVMPFLRIATADASCTADCKIGSIEYRWMEHTETGWQDASPAVVALMPAAQLNVVGVVASGATGAMTVTVPTSSVHGTISWNEQVTSNQLLPYEIANVRTSQLCYVGAVYHDLVGTRLTTAASNPQLACH